MSYDDYGTWGSGFSLSNPTFDSSAWGPSFDTNAPIDKVDYSTSVFDDPNWFTSQNWTPPPDNSQVFDDPNWFGSTDWSSNLDNIYDPLSDSGASTSSIADYVENMFSNPDRYSLAEGDFDLGMGSNILGLSRDNLLGNMLRVNPTDEGSAFSSVEKMLAALQKVLGGGNARSQGGLAGLLKAALGVAAQRKGISNANKNNVQSANLAALGNQRSLGGIRGGLSNMNTSVRDPMSYVQAAPTIAQRS